ncbi:lipid-A-disaccharide synthase-related protein [Leptothermofonsia sichuanensis E412]|uniref:lipid-A-disaccharide synthase-related protein n=1 Tax=Leptothermofonsia sichuanensis TaxID=2917832 RepID=UPI001CA74C9D|nr:lipid-A-disaccharide synthase-related protein [Leptothermofonsia sichuanensis]QZZ20179.1 lipid-A-disaccharide synthase-related protein [Leptothermofonsia sichuanensis E412]
MRLLCLSNGHGEDAIALRILQALQSSPHAPQIEALPIVGEGHAYTRAGIPLIGAVKTMPSGGFVYMDGRQLARDIRGGLLKLTVTQLQAVRAWARGAGRGEASPLSHSPSFILAVGDIVPLLFAWFSGVPYGFVGTAKSEYYIRDEAGWLPRKSWWSDRLERWTGCIYHPWERWLMSRPGCKAVFPRDSITAQNLRRYGIPAFDMGNPMMDGLEWEAPDKGGRIPGEPVISSFIPHPSSLTIVLLPGSRPPEAYGNWEMLLLAVNGLLAQMERPLLLLAAIAPGLDLDRLHQAVQAFRWQPTADGTYAVGFGENRAILVLAQDRYAEFLHRADLAIAMAGTATEQFIGLGKPAITLPGRGPQFTPGFAEAQTRLLGPSVTLVQTPEQVASAIQALLKNPDRLQLIAENGRRRMGPPGSARRIAQCLIEQFRGQEIGNRR